MKITGIVTELNPFHNGHKYIVDTAKADGDTAVVAVMSGNWVQRGDTAVISKFARAEQAVACGVDLVVELPTYWAMATAQKFAYGALQILENIGIDRLCFGSECGDTKRITETAYCIRSAEFSAEMRKNLDSGMSPAKAREAAVETLCGNGELLRSPNDTLAVEYINAAKELNSKMSFDAVTRKAVGHDSDTAHGEFCSAGFLRELLLSGDLSGAERYMPTESFEILKREYENGRISDIKGFEKTVLAVLRAMPKEEYSRLPDISEGIENRLYSAVRISSSFEGLLENSATKRYTNARLRRLIMAAFLRERADSIPDKVPYIRVLGLNTVGAAVLERARKASAIPIIMRSSELKGEPCFEFEQKATDIYTLSQKSPEPCGGEFTHGIFIKKI